MTFWKQLALCVLLSCVGHAALAADERPKSVSAADLAKARVEAAEREVGLLKEFRAELTAAEQALERQADRNFGLLESMANRVIWAYGAIAAAFGVFIVWLGFSSRREMRKFLNRWQKDEAQKMVEATTTDLRKIVDSATSQLRERVGGMQDQIKAMLDYRNRPITWVTPPFAWRVVDGEARNLKAEAIEEILAALRASGLERIQFIAPQEGAGTAEIGDAALVILSYDGSPDARALLASVVEQLKRRSPPVFLILDTATPTRPYVLVADDFALLEGFLWYVPINFPSQLVAQTQLLIRRDPSIGSLAAHG